MSGSNRSSRRSPPQCNRRPAGAFRHEAAGRRSATVAVPMPQARSPATAPRLCHTNAPPMLRRHFPSMLLLALSSCSLFPDEPPRASTHDGGHEAAAGSGGPPVDAATGGSGGVPSSGGASGSGATAGTAGSDAAVGGMAGTAGSAGNDAGLDCGEAPVPPGDACPALCDECTTDHTCVIACNDATSCSARAVECPAGFSCLVRCTAKRSCAGSSVVCNEAYPCEVDCAGKESCTGATLSCSTGPCRMHCLDNPLATCMNAALSCGTNRCEAICDGSSKPLVTCGSSCDCTPCP